MRTFRVVAYVALAILGFTAREGWTATPPPPPPIQGKIVIPPISTLTITPVAAVGNQSCAGEVVLASPVEGAPAVISLRSPLPETASVPTSVTIPIGFWAANFTVQVRAQLSPTVLGITAQSGLSTKTVWIRVDPLQIKSLLLADAHPTPLTGGKTVNVEATLNGTAPPGGAVIMLESWGLAQIPGFVKVLEGSRSASFPAVIPPVKEPVTMSVLASYVNGGPFLNLSVVPPKLATLRLTPDNAIGGASVTGLMTLSGIAPSGGWWIYLQSDQPMAAATPQVSAHIPAGAHEGSFSITTRPVRYAVHANITGSSGEGIPGTDPVSTTLSVNPPALTGFTLNPTTVSSQAGTVDGLITLSGPAAAGTSVPLSWSSVDGATAPPTVPVAEGASTANFTVTLKPVLVPTPFTLLAFYGGSRMSATLTVNP